MSLWSNTDTQAAKPKWLGLGQVQAINVTAGGSGYTPTNGTASVTIDAPPAGGVQATATVTIVGGVLTSVAVTNPGAGYTTAPACTYTTGGTLGTLAGVIKGVDTHGPVNSRIVFVDLQEAQNASNRAKGIKTPGWVEVKEWATGDGSPRYQINTLVVMKRDVSDAGDSTDDVYVGDTAFGIDTEPVDRSIVAPSGTTFVVVGDAGADGYQWQVQAATGGLFANVANTGVYSGATLATLTISDVTGLNGKKYRCQVANSTAGAYATSRAALLVVPYGIATQPSNDSVTAPAASSFTIVAVGTTTYQWQSKAPAGAWANQANVGVFSGATTDTLAISDSTGLDQYEFRCVVSDGTTTITSAAGVLTVA